MPFLRYLVSVGGVLIVLLFAANWIWPSAPPVPAQQPSTESAVEKSIRIRSARRWPDKIDFDTTQPTIVPPPPVVAEAPPAPPAPAPVVAENSPLDARAEVKPAAKPAPKRQARTRHHNNYYAQPQPQPDFWGRPPTFASAGPSWSFGRW